MSGSEIMPGYKGLVFGATLLMKLGHINVV